MAIWARVKTLNVRQFFALSLAFTLKPRYIIPTYKATKETVEICDNLFGIKHHEDNRTNAFRHALWNFKICEKCYRTSGSEEKAVNWSMKITDLHEKLFPNEDLPQIMDLHNNRIGREVFQDCINQTFDPIWILKEKMKEAVKVKTKEDVENAPNKLVFLEKLKEAI